ARRWVFPLMFIAAALLPMACIFPVFVGHPQAPDTGVLNVDINYTGSWYRETFQYARDAANIRHFVLVVPESEASRADPVWIFTSLAFQEDGGLTVSADRQEYAWALEYVHDAPGGYFEGAFAPGRYAVAVAFIAAPLSQEEAGAGPDAILWPGITGGGASTEYQTVVVDAGKTTSIRVQVTDDNGWACPWLYVYTGHSFERRTEILRNVRGPDQERSEITPLGPVPVVDGFIIIHVAEERDEETFIDALYLRIKGVTLLAEGDPVRAAHVAAVDGDRLVLHRGEAYEMRFRVPSSYVEGDPVEVIAAGYYDSSEP
ncbi:MAG TPA: hypothetical protein VMT24_01220, partial [Aggregatilineaceae bacterium]|nr:hypothetical protein [Aggregatilineaceae bacterium]